LPRSHRRRHRVVPGGDSLGGNSLGGKPFDGKPLAPANRRGEFLIQRGRRPIVSHMSLLYPFPINGSPRKSTPMKIDADDNNERGSRLLIRHMEHAPFIRHSPAIQTISEFYVFLFVHGRTRRDKAAARQASR
jgi:hypothetical protein